MIKRLSLFSFALACAGCLEPTQVTFVISTDIPCASLGSVALYAGLDGETEKASPVKVVQSCESDGSVSAIGTYSVVPKGSRDISIAFKAVVSPDSSRDVVADCIASKGYRGCIVARRRVSLVAHRSLTVPILLRSACRDVQCDANSSCGGSGTCTSAEVDTTSCDRTNTCPAVVTLRSGGLDCFNESSVDRLFCGGDAAWCARASDGTRTCSEKPLEGGISYQCRNAGDCGPNLKCVSGTAGVIARCVVDPSLDSILLCTPDDERASCGGAKGACSIDAGVGFLSCTRQLLVDARSTAVPADGLTWATAYPTVQGALNDPQIGPGWNVWVARGRYVNAGAANEPVAAVPSGVSLYGGFLGTEKALVDRRPGLASDTDAERTVLDGDALGNGNPHYTDVQAPVFDNSVHVVTVSSGSVLDGLTIRNGAAMRSSTATADDPRVKGGGVLVAAGATGVKLVDTSQPKASFT